MERTIKNVVKDLITQIEDYGVQEETILLYESVCLSLINHCNKKEDEPYTNQIPTEFLDKAKECYENGIHCYEYYRLIKRTVRLLDTFARTGTPDFTRASGTKKYVTSSEHQDLIREILNENQLINDAWSEMDRIMRHFFCFIEDSAIQVSELNDITLFRFIQVAATTKQGSMYRVVRAIKLISNYLKKHHMAELKMDFSMLQIKSAPVRMIEPFSHDEVNRMISSINCETPMGMRDKAIILLAFETGLRAIDIVKLRKSDIDWRNMEVHIIQSKTHETLSLPINGTVMNAVADYLLKARPESNRSEIFLSSKAPYKPLNCACALDSRIKKYSALAGVEKKPYRSFHSLRRAFATELSAAGVPLPTISQMLGHKSIKKVRPYLSYNRSQISFCALGFDEIPITDGIYVPLLNKPLNPSWERSDDK